MSRRVRIQIGVLFVMLICSQLCLAQTRQTQSRQTGSRSGAPFLQQVKAYEETPHVTKVVLKNGMTVLVNEYRIQPVVSMQIYVHTGFWADPPQSPGMARLVAGIVQRGSADKSGGTYRQKVHAIGGILRSATDYGTTRFEIVAPSSRWKTALTAQSEAILNPAFSQSEIGMEMRLIQSEAREILDNPLAFGKEKLLEMAFGQPRMGKYGAIMGGMPSSFTPEILAAFYKAQYTPEKMMLVVSGDIASNEILNEVVRVYMRPSSPAAKMASFPFSISQNTLRYRSVRGNVSIPYLFWGFHGVPENDEDSRALEIVNAALGLGDGSILLTRLRDQKKLIMSADANLMAYPELGYFYIGMLVNSADIDKAEIAFLTEIELLKREELADAEMERALAQLERAYWAGLETVTQRANTLARSEYLGDWKRMDRHISDLRKVKPADVKRVAAKYLRLEKCSLLEYLPAAGEERSATAEGIRNAFAALVTSSADQEQLERNKKTVLAIKIPVNAGAFRFSEIQYPFQIASILRGPDLFIREDHTNPLIQMGLFFPGGRLDEQQENAGITKLLTRLMLRGSADINQFYRQLEVYGGQVRPIVVDDYFGFSFTILSQNFEPGLKLLIDAIHAPSFERDEIQNQKDIQIAEILSRKNYDDYPKQWIAQALFKGFSYSLDPDGSAESLSSITPEALKGWYDAHVKNRKPVVVAIGDTKGTSLASTFVQRFSGSRIQASKLPEGFTKPLEKGESAEQNWDRDESLILVGFQAPPEDDEDGYAVAVLQNLTGDPGRLSQELRDRLGAAHQVFVDYQPRLRGGSFMIRVAMSPDREEEVFKSLRIEIEKICSDPIPYRDFRSAVNEAVGALAIEQQARLVQIRDITQNVLAGKGIEGYKNYSAGLQSVSEEDLKTAAQRIFNMDKAVILRMHGRIH
jgi:zinc protease